MPTVFLAQTFPHPRLMQTWLNGHSLLKLHWLAHPFTITLTSHTRLQPRLIQTAPTPHSIDLLHSSRQPRFGNPGMIEPIGSTLPIPRFSHTLLHPCLTQRPFIPQSDDIWHWVIHLVLIGLMGLTGSIGLTGQRGSTGKTPLPLQTRLHPTDSQRKPGWQGDINEHSWRHFVFGAYSDKERKIWITETLIRQ